MSFVAIAGGALIGGAVGIGGAMLAGKPKVSQPQQFKPQTFDPSKTMDQWHSIIKDNWGDATQYANKTNDFNLKSAITEYTGMQPEFMKLQKQLGDNALSMSEGHLPSDVVANIGRAAREQGFTNGTGVGGGAGGSSFLGTNSSTSNLDLRNLGMSSIDLMNQGDQLGMAVNQQAKALSPTLVSPTDFLPSLGDMMSIGQNNNNLTNSANLSNLSAMNQFHQNQDNADYAYRMSMVNGLMSGIKMGTGAASGMGGMGGGAGTSGAPTAALQGAAPGGYEGQMNGQSVFRATAV